MQAFLRALALAAALLASAALARAQVGTTTDIITGRVTGPDGQPLAGAVVEAKSVDTQLSRQRTTDAQGRFTILFPDGGGQYQLIARFIGMAPATLTVARQADEDRLVANIQMGVAAVTLAPVTVTARRARPEERTPGSTERDLNPALLARLPIDASDLNTLATLAPGVVGIAATDTTDAVFSVAGQRTTANNITLDGMSFGSGTVPQDAIRSTRVVTSTYDVARGQFSGGLVASTTRSGTNVPQGAYTYTLRDHNLAWGGPTASPFGGAYTQNQLGGGMGGPIVQNKVFVFGALQGRWRSQGLTSLSTADPATLARLGVSPDSVARFIGLVQSAGAPITVPDLPDDRTNDYTVGLLRLDWNATDAQTLMLRLDGRWTSQQPTRLGALALPPTGSTSAQQGGGIMASLTSYFGGNFINELRGYISTASRDAGSYVTLPAAHVQVASPLGGAGAGGTGGGFGGGQGVANLSFGGSGALTQSTRTRSLEFTDEFSWLPGATAHRIKLGAYLNGSELQALPPTNQLGVFTYPSLAAFAADSASSFTRTLVPLEPHGTAWNAALYLGDSWRVNDALQLTYGARLEDARFSGAPQYNPTVDSVFGIRTDQLPSEVHASPRVGFTWMFGGEGGLPTNIIRGGVGDFRSLTPTGLYSAAFAAPGLSNAETQLVCVGAAVPTADWSAYVANPSAIPSTCTDTVNAVTITAHPNVTAFAPGFSAPRAWRASLGVQHRFLGTYTVSVDGSYARGMSQYGFRDLNLVTTPYFKLANEGNRPVYVPADSIVPTTGAVSLSGSRRDPAFGQVLLVGSDLQSDTKQLTVGLSGFTARGLTFQLSYTYTRAQDQSSFGLGAAAQGFAAATTAGDPNTREWATSDFERRHSLLGTLTFPITAALEITAIGRLASGTPFTPLVGSDINGDGARNDRAFVFDPATTTDTAVARGMHALLASAPAAVRSCLTNQLGQIAARNSCSGPWQPALDLQINWRPAWLGLDRRLTLSIVTVNLLGGLDEWLHGAAHLEGWGFNAAPDPVLLYVRGFDATTDEFRYAVNGRFGATAGANGGVTVPFQIGFQAHFALGPDRTRDRLRSVFGRRGGAAPEGAGPPDFAARFSQILPNPITVIIGLKDSLHLSLEQTAGLQAIADSLDKENGAVRDSVQADVQRAGDRPDPGILFARMRPRLAKGHENIQRALERARAVLTPEQWRLVPEAIRSPRFRGRGPDD